MTVSDARDRLGRHFGAEALTAIEDYVTARVADALADAPRLDDAPRWLTLEQAAVKLGCTPDAARMRARRGRLVTRYQGRRLYVSAASVDGLA